jgi:PII-like signaling protein
MRWTEAAKLVRLHFCESDRHDGKPMYEAVVDRCQASGIASAMVFRGLEGFGETGELHHRRLLHKDQPIVVTIVDTADNVARLLPELEAMMDTGMIAISDVDWIQPSL